jgi:hypothetical protein
LSVIWGDPNIWRRVNKGRGKWRGKWKKHKEETFSKRKGGEKRKERGK